LSRYDDERRAGNGGAAVAFGALAAFAFTVFIAGMVFGVQVMLTKGES
jgi:hypothetical protein